MNILITGVAGFVGNNLVNSLLAKGCKIWGVDNFYNSDETRVNKNITFIEGDISNDLWRKELDGIKIDMIVHLAAQSSGEVSFRDPIYDLDTNIKGTMQVCLYAKEFNVKRIIFASSMSVYGASQGLVSEEDATIPLSLYAVGKKASEDYLRIFSDEYGIDVVSLRLFNIYGNGQNLLNLDQGMVSIFLAQLLSNSSSILVKGSLKRFRDFIHVYDVIKVVDHFVFSDLLRPKYQVFNVGTSMKTTIKDLIANLADEFMIKKNIVIKGNTPGDQTGIIADNNKLLDEIPLDFISVPEGLALWRKELAC